MNSLKIKILNGNGKTAKDWKNRRFEDKDMKAYKRATRVAELIQKNIAEILRDIKELTGLVTVTSVRLTDDLQTCRIFYSVIGSDTDKKNAEKVLTENLKQIRYNLAQNMELRRTPTIDFKYDDSGEKAERIFEILDKIEHEKDNKK